MTTSALLAWGAAVVVVSALCIALGGSPVTNSIALVIGVVILLRAT